MASVSGGTLMSVFGWYGCPYRFTIVLAFSFSQPPHTVEVHASDPRSFRHGHTVSACWKRSVHVAPSRSLSFLNKVTLSTFSMLDTKYSSASEIISSRKLASRH